MKLTFLVVFASYVLAFMTSVRSKPVVSLILSIVLARTDGTLPLKVPTPFSPEPPSIIVTLSMLSSGFAIASAICGRTLIIISVMAALPYLAIASAFFSIASASARPLALILSASARPFALMLSASAIPCALTASASCSFANLSASACAFLASACF